MRLARASRGWLAAGGAFSVLVHVAGGLLAIAWAGGDPAGTDALVSADEPLLERDESKPSLGIQNSRSVSINWLGFETPTEHRAQLAETEQAALSMAPMGEPLDQPASATTGEGRTARAPVAPAEAEGAPGGEVGPPAPSEPSRALVVRPHESEEADVPAAVEVGRPALPSARDPLAGEGGGGGRGPEGAPVGGDDQPGEPSDRESVATALREAIDLSEWGRPLAREGLEVKTVRPRWSVTTRLARSPRNPVLIIRFGADGAVRSAEFLRDKRMIFSTGFSDVDGPLLDAVYRWRAQGRAIEALGEGGEHQISVRVVLRR